MQLPNNTEEDFLANLRSERGFGKILKDLKKLINTHYGYTIELDKLIPYALIRFLVRKLLNEETWIVYFIQFKKILDLISKDTSKLNI